MIEKNITVFNVIIIYFEIMYTHEKQYFLK